MCVTAASEALKLFQTPFNHLLMDFSWSLHLECELNMYRAQVCTRDICCLSVWNQLWGTHMSSQNAIKCCKTQCCKTHYILVLAVLRVIQESDGRSIQKGALFCTCGCTFFLCEVILLAVIFTRNQDKLQSKVLNIFILLVAWFWPVATMAKHMLSGKIWWRSTTHRAWEELGKKGEKCDIIVGWLVTEQL